MQGLRDMGLVAEGTSDSLVINELLLAAGREGREPRNTDTASINTQWSEGGLDMDQLMRQ